MREFAQRIRGSVRTAYRIVQNGEVETFMIGGKRLIDDDSADAYIERCKAKGPQFEPPPATGKRPPGRPRKTPKPAQSADANKARPL
jgi:hypothetical protein